MTHENNGWSEGWKGYKPTPCSKEEVLYNFRLKKSGFKIRHLLRYYLAH